MKGDGGGQRTGIMNKEGRIKKECSMLNVQYSMINNY
jgi:hypothetical protein